MCNATFRSKPPCQASFVLRLKVGMWATCFDYWCTSLLLSWSGNFLCHCVFVPLKTLQNTLQVLRHASFWFAHDSSHQSRTEMRLWEAATTYGKRGWWAAYLMLMWCYANCQGLSVIPWWHKGVKWGHVRYDLLLSRFEGLWRQIFPFRVDVHGSIGKRPRIVLVSQQLLNNLNCCIQELLRRAKYLRFRQRSSGFPHLSEWETLRDIVRYIDQVFISEPWFDLDGAIANDAQSTKLSWYRVDALIVMLSLAHRISMFINN